MSDQTDSAIASRTVISSFAHGRLLISIHYLRCARIAVKLFSLVSNRVFACEQHKRPIAWSTPIPCVVRCRRLEYGSSEEEVLFFVFHHIQFRRHCVGEK